MDNGYLWYRPYKDVRITYSHQKRSAVTLYIYISY
jgi:hypothetical protein